MGPWEEISPLLATLLGQLLRGPFCKLPEAIVSATCRAQLAQPLRGRETRAVSETPGMSPNPLLKLFPVAGRLHPLSSYCTALLV